MITLSVIIPARDPDPARLARVFAALRAQTLPLSAWDILLVDNASSPPLDLANLAPDAPPNLRLVREPSPGLSLARLRGFAETTSDFLVLVDDDNVLSPDYLALALDHMRRHPALGACGGPSRPEFASPPPSWAQEFFPLLALRDFGPSPVISPPSFSSFGQPRYPANSPVGAGMVLRRTALAAWMRRRPRSPRITDRTGDQLSSGGDNDIVLTLLRDGWNIGYFPDLALTHLIPASRLRPAYLARLNRAIQRSWMQVLHLHEANPWPPIPRWTVPLRQARAWLNRRAWSSPAAFIRWQGDCGHFEGRAS